MQSVTLARRPTVLPNEVLKDMLHCADYSTLVLVTLAGKRLLDVVAAFAEDLALRRRFRVIFNRFCIKYTDVPTGAPTGAPWKTIPYKHDHQQSLADACRKLAEVVGPHAVVQLMFERSWNMPCDGAIFEAASPLKHAEMVELYSPFESTISSNSYAFMSSFSGLKEFRLRLDSARELRLIKFWSEDVKNNGFIEGLVIFCATLPRLRGGEPLELDFSESVFPVAFGRRIVKVSNRKSCP